ncbi:unnamed protein product, partial [Laminaria digitata]
MAWERMFPQAPPRSNGMVVVQTGLLGTLAVGLALVGARSMAPAGWSSDFRRHALSYAVAAAGTVCWLSSWTAPLLGSNPVSWVVLFTLGHSDLLSARTHGSGGGGGNGSGGGAVQLPSNENASSLLGRAWWELVTLAGEVGGVLERGDGGNRPLLVAGWVAALAVVVPLAPRLSRRFSLSKTASRKVFHALATVMFLPAIGLEPEFLSLALGAALGVLLALEFLRCAGCPPVAAALDVYYGGFLDARDGGYFVVTHLFLLLGCAVPVWLSGLAGNRLGVLPYAGVIVLGVGDAM